MTEYLKPRFTVAMGGAEYRDGWDRVFGKKKQPAETDVYGFAASPCDGCEKAGQEGACMACEHMMPTEDGNAED